VLQAGSQTYSNVTVTSKTSHNIVISHAHGMTSIKLKDLSDDVLTQLGYVVEPPPKPKLDVLSQKLYALDPRIKETMDKLVQEAQTFYRQLDPMVLQGALIGLGLGYLFFCYCCMVLCHKTGQKPGLLVWLPVFQIFPMLKAAGMSGWSFLLLLVPIVGIGVFIRWCIKICRVRGKSSWTALFLFIPLSNIFAFLYLAFADGAIEEKTSGPKKITFD